MLFTPKVATLANKPDGDEGIKSTGDKFYEIINNIKPIKLTSSMTITVIETDGYRYNCKIHTYII